MPNNIKIGQCFTELFKKNWHSFFETRCTILEAVINLMLGLF